MSHKTKTPLDVQLSTAKARIEKLEAERDSYRAGYAALLSKHEHADSEERGRCVCSVLQSNLLHKVAEAIIIGRLVSHPQLAHVIDQPNADVTRLNGFTDRPAPGASTSAARSASNHFVKQVWKAVNEFNAAKDRNWQRRKEAPMVRCGIRDCDRYGRKVPAWEFWNGRTFYNEKCSTCGNTLKGIEDEKSLTGVID